MADETKDRAAELEDENSEEELRHKASELEVEGRSSMNKAELARAIAEHENAGRESTATTRRDGAEGSRRSRLADDDPRKGTPDDPDVDDPYAHLRNRALGIELLGVAAGGELAKDLF